MSLRLAPLLALLLTLVHPLATAQDAPSPSDIHVTSASDRKPVHYLLATPADLDTQQPVRLVIAFPPGTQTESIARASMERSFGDTLAARGYVVVMPFNSASGGSLDTDAFDTLMSHMTTLFSIEGDTALLCGVQNGGKAAFRIALDRPDRISALLALPGIPPTADEASLAPLSRMPIAMYVGSEDSRWRSECDSAHAALVRAGARCSLTVVPGDGHMLPSMTPARIADALDRLVRLAAGITPESEVGTMLDRWHAAAASADENAYFALFADDSSIFMGTDATERWTATEFRAWAKPFFDRGRAWAFKCVERHVYLSPDGSVAWFDEVLDTPNMGPCRGTGVATSRDGVWKVAHYNLTVPVPNAIIDRVVEMVAEELQHPTPAPTEPGANRPSTDPPG